MVSQVIHIYALSEELSETITFCKISSAFEVVFPILCYKQVHAAWLQENLPQNSTLRLSLKPLFMKKGCPSIGSCLKDIFYIALNALLWRVHWVTTTTKFKVMSSAIKTYIKIIIILWNISVPCHIRLVYDMWFVPLLYHIHDNQISPMETQVRKRRALPR